MIVVMLVMIVNMNDALYKRTTKANARMTQTVVDTVIYGDLIAACYNLDSSGAYNASNTFVQANTRQLRFWADTSTSTPSYDVRYTVDTTVTPYRLYRRIGTGTSLLLGKSFTQASFAYYGADGRVVTGLPSSVRSVRVRLQSYVSGLGSRDSVFTRDFRVYPPHVF